MTGGKLAAACLMATAMIGAILVFGYDIGADSQDLVLPVIGAAIVGLYSGWTQLGRNLGGDYVQSGVFGVGAGVVAVIWFAFLYGMRSAYKTHVSLQFDTGVEAVLHVLDQGLKVVMSAVLSYPTLLAIIIGGFVAGMIAEYCNRIWR